MEEYLKKLKDIKPLEKWLKDTTYNPLTQQNDVKMSLKEDSDYVMLYNKTFQMLRKNGMKTHNILKKMPKDHLLFNNKIDYLYVYYNLDNDNYPYEDNDKKYTIYKNYVKSGEIITGNIIFEKISYIIDYKNIEPDKYENEIIIDCYDYMIECIDYFIRLIRYKIFTNFTLEKLEREYKKEAYEKRDEINNIKDFFNFIKYDFKLKIYNYKNELYENDFKNITVEEAVLIAKDVFKMVDYTDSGKDVIEIITESKLKIIEDPLIDLLSKKEFKNIDIANLELPEQNMTDKQLKNLTEEYKILTDNFNKSKTLLLSQSKSPPKRPTLELPNKKIIQVGIHKIPKQNYTDNDYKKLKTNYEKNKHIIDLYKQLINTGFLDLKSKSSSSKSSSMLNKSREDIIKDDLFNENITDDSRLSRCINETDIISQEDFNSASYPLAKLQLMTKLKIKDENGKILRTDCYYTPNLYNYLIDKANNKKPFTDPYNGKYILTNKDVNDVMKIMKIIDPKLEKPRYIKNSNDKLFMIDADINEYNIYNVYIYRLFGKTKFKIQTIFVFPADIEVKDTGSSDLTSATLILKIFELFNNGKLMETYLPPYKINNFYLLPDIDYNAYNDINKWVTMSYKKKIDLFKRMATEINRI
jgi:hypothetical protein